MIPFIIMSYPRSGNTLLRFIIENAFNIRTYGYTSFIDIAPLRYQLNSYRKYDDDYIGFKRHNEVHGFTGYEPLIFLKRDKGYTIVRHIKEGINLILCEEEKSYDKGIEIFKQWQGRKILIDYTDFDNFDLLIEKLSVFFNKKAQIINEKILRKDCLALYTTENNSYTHNIIK